jgi:hypothetical protein
MNSPGPPTLGSQAALQATGWVLGFLSGIGSTGGSNDPLDGVDGESVRAWINNYCKAHPTEAIEEAAEAFYFAHPHR